jgi:hypothetical protein
MELGLEGKVAIVLPGLLSSEVMELPLHLLWLKRELI